MAKLVAVLCHLEPLPPLDHDDWSHFSLNLTVAMERDVERDDVANYLSPWLWTLTAPARPTLTVRTATGNTLETDALTAEVLAPPAMTNEGLANWIGTRETRGTLGTVRAAFAADVMGMFPASRFRWQPTPDETALTQDAAARPWHAFLSHVSTLPAPLPQRAQVSFVFRVSKTQLGTTDEIMAAPVFAFDDGAGERTPTQPTNLQLDLNAPGNPLHRVQVGATAASQEPFFYSWAYGVKNGVEVHAYQAGCFWQRTAPKKPEQFIDFSTGWITPAGDTAGVYTEDWTEALHSRSADVFDLAHHLLEALRTHLDDAAFTADTQGLLEAVLIAMRDIAGLGLRVAPDGSSVVEEVVRRCLAPAPDDTSWRQILAAVQGALAAYDAGISLTSWRVLLGVVFDELHYDVGPLLVLSPDNGIFDDHTDALREVARIQAAVADPTVLLALVSRQWKDSLTSDQAAAVAKQFWTDHEQRVRAILAELQLRKRLSAEGLGASWRALTSIQEDLGNTVKKNLEDVLAVYLDSRFGLVQNGPYAMFTPRPEGPQVQALQQLRTALHDWLKLTADAFCDEHILAPTKSYDSLPPREVPDGLAIQVDRLGRAQDDIGGGDDQADFLRRIAGVGVLLRRTTPKLSTWTCLNYATLAGPAGLIHDVALAPVRLHYRSGLRQAFVVYDNQPLIARSPVSQLPQQHGFLPPDPASGGTHAPGDLDFPFLEYRNPYGHTFGNGQAMSFTPRLVGLTYGEDYEAAVFVIGNGGTLPGDLVTLDLPWTMRPPEDIVVPANVVWPSIRYRRRVSIGAVRGGSPKGRSPGQETESLPDLPVIPPVVAPIARSLLADATMLSDLRQSKDPLLLLRPGGDEWTTAVKSTFEFRVRPPAADLNVFDRWTSRSSALRDLRRHVWAAFYRTVEQTVPKEGAPDITIDDPAVKRLAFRLTSVYGTSVTVLEKLSDPLDLTGTTDLQVVQAKKTPVTVSVVTSVASDDERLTVTAAGASIKLLPGEVWRLEVYSAVDVADGIRFHTVVWDNGVEAHAGQPYRLFSPLTLLIEAATAEMPSESALHGALEAQAVERDRKYQVWMNPLTGGQWLHRVELLTQRWRWQGRPIPEFTFDAFLASFKDGVWDGALFGDRDSGDHLRQTAFVDFQQKIDRQQLVEQPVSDGAALYYRFAIRAFSRYAGILRTRPKDSRDAGAVTEEWRRLVLRCRLDREVPAPAVKLVLPLTEIVREPDGTRKASTPGLLVILNDRWYDHGGLAEEFVAEVMETRWPDPPETGSKLPELGPDPLVEIAPLVADQVVTIGAPVGAIGYTFDTDTRAPKFVASAFFLPAPTQVTVQPPSGTPKTVTDLSWYFVKLGIDTK